MLATWLVLDRAPRRWYVPVVVTVLLAWTEVADNFALLVGVVPLAAVATVRAYRALVQRRGITAARRPGCDEISGLRRQPESRRAYQRSAVRWNNIARSSSEKAEKIAS